MIISKALAQHVVSRLTAACQAAMQVSLPRSVCIRGSAGHQRPGVGTPTHHSHRTDRPTRAISIRAAGHRLRALLTHAADHDRGNTLSKEENKFTSHSATFRLVIRLSVPRLIRDASTSQCAGHATIYFRHAPTDGDFGRGFGGSIRWRKSPKWWLVGACDDGISLATHATTWRDGWCPWRPPHLPARRRCTRHQ